MNRTLIAMLAAGALVACGEDDAGTKTPTFSVPEAPETPSEPEAPVERPDPPVERPDEVAPRPGPSAMDVDGENVGQAELAPPAPVRYPTSRARRRMNVDQLDAAFRRTSGGIGWTEQRGNNTINLFEELSATLGKPDYIQITSESLEPSALFQKFLDDAGRKVCAEIVERDRRSPADAVLLPDAGPDGEVDIDGHLRHLVLRWHGRDLALDSPDLMHWRWLYDSVDFVGKDDATAWEAVCATLYTHPDFYSY